MLRIAASHHRIQFDGQRMIQTRENREKPHFRTGLGPFGPNLGH